MKAELQEKVNASIERIKAFEPQDGYFLAYSGGKDSTVLLELARRAGVKFDVHYSVTTVDPPELVRFVIGQFDTVIYAYLNGTQKRFCVQGGRLVRDENASGREIWFDLPKNPMHKLIQKKKMPPTRLMRYCCEELKEAHGEGRVTMTGVRWAESLNRKQKQGIAVIIGNVRDIAVENNVEYREQQNAIVMNDDNDEARRTVEICYRTHKTLVNPIVDWTDQDVWDFIKGERLAYCSLYDKGYKRIGCIGCPLGSFTSQKWELNQYPAMRNMYITAFNKMLEERRKNRKPIDERWKDGESVMKWWTGGFEGVAKGQISIDELLEVSE